MPWIALTSADVARRFAAAELTAVKTAAKATGQDGDVILAAAITSVTNTVRGYVSACAKNTLGDGATIPDELETAALALIRDYLFNRLPGMRALNDELRQKETDRAMSQLRDAGKGLLGIVAPVTASEDQAAGPAMELVSSRTRVATRTSMSGLM